MKVFLFILIIILSSHLLSLNAQTFLRGAFVNSGGHNSIEVQNQDSIKAAGFNAVVNRVYHPDIIYHPTNDNTIFPFNFSK